jgi:ABC-type Mn2+/Zn2+ transport system ATPase subunit
MRLQLSWRSVHYEQRQILSNVALALMPADVLLVLGNNGAGKSTLLKAVTGLRCARARRYGIFVAIRCCVYNTICAREY